MSQTSLTGAFGFGPQSAKSVAGSTFYWYRAYNVDYGPVIDERPFPQEVGGVLTPTGAFRAGVFAAGGLDFTPRLFDDFAWILSWLLGENPTTTIDNPVATVNRHRWVLDGSEDTLFWGTVRTITPGTVDLGIQSLDNKSTMLRLAIPQAGLVQARLDLVGRLFNLVTDTVLYESPPWTTDFEDFGSVPISAKGGVIVTGLNGGAEIPLTNMVVDFSNAVTTPQQEMVIGSYNPEDYVPVAKTVTYRGTMKWSNPDDYQRIFGGSATAAVWTDKVFESAATVEMQAPGNILATTTPYELEITSPNCVWQMGTPRLAGANIIMVDLVGTAIKKAGANFVQVDLFTESADGGYAWPT